MSYDVSIGDESFNITSNVGKLFYDHIPQVDSEGGLHELDGKTGKQAFMILSGAIEKINRTRIDLWRESDVGEQKFCARYDAKNGWGSTVGAILFLTRVMAACVRNPRNKVSVHS